MDEVKKCANWTQFRTLIEGWTDSLSTSLKQKEQLIINNNLKIEKNMKLLKHLALDLLE